MLPAYYPYRSQAIRDSCLAFYESLAAREWPIQSEACTVPTPYGPTFVRISGPPEAPPLVLLHGAGSTSLMWRPNVLALSAGHRTYAIDQMEEVGLSTCTQPVRNMAGLVDWLDHLFDALGLDRGIDLAGLSYGGALATQYALRHPERLHRVVLLAPGNTVLRVSVGFIARVLAMMLFGEGATRAFVQWIFADMVRRSPAWGEAITREILMVRGSLQHRQVPIPPVLTDDQWRSLAVPVLFLVGEHERIYSPRRAVERLRRVAPGIQAEVVPGAGHDLSFVQADLVNQRILAFLG